MQNFLVIGDTRSGKNVCLMEKYDTEWGVRGMNEDGVYTENVKGNKLQRKGVESEWKKIGWDQLE